MGLGLYASIFYEIKTVYTKLVPEAAHYISFNSKFILNYLYLFIIFIIYF